MKVSLPFLLLAVGVVLGGCQQEPADGSVDDDLCDGGLDCDASDDWVTDELFGAGYVLMADPAPTVDADNILRAVVLYGGGCGDHHFTYRVWNVGRSLPPTSLGALHHQTADPCLASMRTSIEIDLTEALEDMGCVGRVSIVARTDTGADGYIFAIDPVSCDDIFEPDIDLNPDFTPGQERP